MQNITCNKKTEQTIFKPQTGRKQELWKALIKRVLYLKSKQYDYIYKLLLDSNCMRLPYNKLASDLVHVSTKTKNALITPQIIWHKPLSKHQICLFSAVCLVFSATDLWQRNLYFFYSLRSFMPFLEHHKVTQFMMFFKTLLHFFGHVL